MRWSAGSECLCSAAVLVLCVIPVGGMLLAGGMLPAGGVLPACWSGGARAWCQKKQCAGGAGCYVKLFSDQYDPTDPPVLVKGLPGRRERTGLCLSWEIGCIPGHFRTWERKRAARSRGAFPLEISCTCTFPPS